MKGKLRADFRTSLTGECEQILDDERGKSGQSLGVCIQALVFKLLSGFDSEQRRVLHCTDMEKPPKGPDQPKQLCSRWNQTWREELRTAARGLVH